VSLRTLGALCRRRTGWWPGDRWSRRGEPASRQVDPVGGGGPAHRPTRPRARSASAG